MANASLMHEDVGHLLREAGDSRPFDWPDLGVPARTGNFSQDLVDAVENNPVVEGWGNKLIFIQPERGRISS